jgi:hypothetical protein
MSLITLSIITSISLILIYIAIFFLASRLIIPNLGFAKSKLPKKIPNEINKRIRLLKKSSKNKKEYLINTYNFLTEKYHGKRRTVLKRPKLLFENNIKNIWKKKGFIPCHTFSHMTRLFLIKSKLFRERDIKIKHTFFQFSIHQYLEVRIKNKWHKVDGWAKNIGIKFGDCACMFK